jgi:hypothetical protein
VSAPRELSDVERVAMREAREAWWAGVSRRGHALTKDEIFGAGYRVALAGREPQTLASTWKCEHCGFVTHHTVAREVEELPGDREKPDHIDRLAKAIEGAVPGATPQEAAELREAIATEDRRAREELPGDGQRPEVGLANRVYDIAQELEQTPEHALSAIIELTEPFVRDTEREHEPAALIDFDDLEETA